jgi:hypothetical protein
MTAGQFVRGTRAVRVGRPLGQETRGPAAHVVDAIHAVAKPVVDGLDSSVCGLLVTATAAEDWAGVQNVRRCEECSRIAG